MFLCSVYYVSLISSNNGNILPEYKLDGDPLQADWMCVENGFGCDYIYTNFTVAEGLHNIVAESNDTFLGWTYAYQFDDAYGTIIGLSGNDFELFKMSFNRILT